MRCRLGLGVQSLRYTMAASFLALPFFPQQPPLHRHLSKCSPISLCAHHLHTLPPVQAPASNPTISRRLAFSFGLSLLLLPPLRYPAPALAKDVPIFGIRKRVEKLEEEVVKEVKELVREGEQEVKQLAEEGEKETLSAVAGVVKSFGPSVPFSSSPSEGPPPVIQAGAVLGAELAAVLAATSVVNGLLRQP